MRAQSQNPFRTVRLNIPRAAAQTGLDSNETMHLLEAAAYERRPVTFAQIGGIHKLGGRLVQSTDSIAYTFFCTYQEVNGENLWDILDHYTQTNLVEHLIKTGVYYGSRWELLLQ